MDERLDCYELLEGAPGLLTTVRCMLARGCTPEEIAELMRSQNPAMSPEGLRRFRLAVEEAAHRIVYGMPSSTFER